MVPKKEKNMLKKFSDEDEDLDEVWKVPAYDDEVAPPVLEKNEVLSAFLATPGWLLAAVLLLISLNGPILFLTTAHLASACPFSEPAVFDLSFELLLFWEDEETEYELLWPEEDPDKSDR